MRASQIRAKISLFEAFPRRRSFIPRKRQFLTNDQVEGWEKEDEDDKNEDDKNEDKQWCRPDDCGMAALLAVEMERGGRPRKRLCDYARQESLIRLSLTQQVHKNLSMKFNKSDPSFILVLGRQDSHSLVRLLGLVGLGINNQRNRP